MHVPMQDRFLLNLTSPTLDGPALRCPGRPFAVISKSLPHMQQLRNYIRQGHRCSRAVSAAACISSRLRTRGRGWLVSSIGSFPSPPTSKSFGPHSCFTPQLLHQPQTWLISKSYMPLIQQTALVTLAEWLTRCPAMSSTSLGSSFGSVGSNPTGDDNVKVPLVPGLFAL